MKTTFVTKYCLFGLLLILTAGTSCKKYLDQRPDKSLVIPQKMEDLQALLDNNNTMNAFPSGIGEASADNYYFTGSDWASLFSEADKEVYIWGPEVFGEYPNVWSDIYKCVYVTNYVLENLEKIPPANDPSEGNNVKGTALFFRANNFFILANACAKAFDSATAATDLGIPLRLSSDFTEPSFRASVKESYERILDDLLQAATLLPITPRHKMRPSRPAAYALLSRVYLAMRNYTRAGLYADSCLQFNRDLMDFNSLNTALTYPMPLFNTEVIFHSHGTVNVLANSRAKIDSVLYDSYAENDLRKKLFYKANNDGTHSFKGSYHGSVNMFLGLATDEVFLTRAECMAREGNVEEALNTLNTLLVKRWKTGTFVPYTAANENEALKTILEERRKELVMRDLRWMDIKRLNKEGWNIKLKRNLDGWEYVLLPNEERYALPLPESVISRSGMPQNPR